MDRVKASRWLNSKLGGQPNQMVCSRVIEERRYGWMLIIDWWWYTFTGEKYHCRVSYRWEEKEKARAQTPR